MMDKKVIFGTIERDNEKYMFKFENNILCIENVKYFEDANTARIEEQPDFSGKLLRGINQENGNVVLFQLSKKKARFIGLKIHLEVQYYIALKKEQKIEKIMITCDELNYIYNISKAIDRCSLKTGGSVYCRIKNFQFTTSETEEFKYDKRPIKIYFTIYREIFSEACEPLHLHSYINLEFEETDKYDFIANLCKIIKEWLAFMCYRKNISISEAILIGKSGKDKRGRIGKIVFEDGIAKEDEKIIKCRHFSYDGLETKIGAMLQDIANKSLYLKHLPESYGDMIKYNPLRLIMVTAAIEWYFGKLHPEGIQHSARTEKAICNIETALSALSDNTNIETALNALMDIFKVETFPDLIAIFQVEITLDELYTKSARKVKDICEKLKKELHSDTLARKIEIFGKEYQELIEPVGIYLYEINGCEKFFDYKKIGERIAAQRNNIAHGNLTGEPKEIIRLDLSYLEKMVYILQLSNYHIDNITILKQIRKLFEINFEVPQSDNVRTSQFLD